MQKALGLLITAAAAYGIYRYTKMSPQQKKELREKGMDLIINKMGMGKLRAKKQSLANGHHR